ncbi:Gfo/Idh/MocA family protein [Oceanobacillus picturae]|uniref:Gfo/Idh/MocA family protein n=1 Tax=Oceanobacillus picturae TaxID=171693 RepID=UPI000E68E9CC|nr:Gfo/Idh/MocA family oxidoreductase [Oceanobacillus picturae]RIU94843.1 gfo/Idh/MocA family oxidoreductase [Oceanobacillus picturae]
MRVGIMSFAHMHAYSYAVSLVKIPGVTLVGVFDKDQGRGEKAAKKYQVPYFKQQDAFLRQDMDAVIICSENIYHKEMVIEAAKAKKHILVEKPIATSVEDAKEMIQICKENGVSLQVAYPVRFSRPIRMLKNMIDAGELGELVAIRSTNRGQNPGGWFIEKELSGGGAVLDHTVHMVDIMRWYTNKEITEVYGVVDSYFHNIDIDDAGILTLEFENGLIATHDSSWSKFYAYPTWGDVTIEVIGTKKSVRVDALKEHYRVYTSGDKALRHIPFGNNMDFDLVQDFINCVKYGRQPSITGYDGLKSMEVALAAYRSSENKTAILL